MSLEIRIIFRPVSFSPRFSSRATIAPTSPRWTPSGLTRTSVRSIGSGTRGESRLGAEQADLAQRPDADLGFSKDGVELDWAETARVAGMVSVVAEHEVLIGWNQLILPGRRPVVVVGPFLGQVGLAQHLPVDVDHAVGDVDALARQRDDPLDEIAAGFIRGLEYDDVAALRRVELVGNLRGDQQV